MILKSLRVMGVKGLLAVILLLAGTGFIPVPQTANPGIIQLSSSGSARAYSVEYSPDGTLLAVGSSLGIHFYAAQTLQEQNFIPTDAAVRSLAFSPDGSVLATGSYDPIVRLWRVRDGKLLGQMSHSAWVRSISFSPDGNLLATASDDDSVVVWDVQQENPILVLRENVTGVRAVRFSPLGDTLATGGFDHVIRLWRVSDGVLLREFTGHTDWVRTLAFSPDGTMLASGAFDATVRLWNVAEGQLLGTRTEHSSSVLSVDFSPDGGLLASASVDSSVRLWQVPDLSPHTLLTGHSDFAYSAAFSPDGKKLASGAADNTVRVWDVPLKSSAAAQDRIATPSNCKVCHHPRANELPPRVIEPGCATCHQNGALVRVWCPALDREPGGTTSQVSYNAPILEGGVPHAVQGLGVVISAPGNGEHFYAPQKIYSLITIDGYVLAGANSLSDIDVQLTVWSGSEQVADLSAKPGEDGKYSFSANIRPEGGDPFPHLDGHQFICLNCHKSGLTILPAGEVRLVVTALLADGTRVTDERMIYVDRSKDASIPVNVLLENGQPAAGIPIQSSTRLYEWRGRTFTAVSDINGNGTLQVEALSQIPTKYKIMLPPVVVNGNLYEGVKPVEITLAPGANSHPPVTLFVRSTRGHLSGQLLPASTSPLDVTAIRIPDGTSFRTRSSSQGTFTFTNLPIGRYLITPDQEDLAALALQTEPQTIDLIQAPSASVELRMTQLSGSNLQGSVHQSGGEPLPFATIMVESPPITQVVNPEFGRFFLAGLPTDDITLFVSAPGYYSQARLVEAGDLSPIELTLTMRKETRSLPWAGGQVIVPPETSLTMQGLDLTMEQGWLWGSSGDGEEPLHITLEEAGIEIRTGSFALEHLPGKPTWLYVFDGQATVQPMAGLETIVISKGQMVALTKGVQPVPVPYDPAVISAFHSDGESPLALVWEQSLKAQFRDRLARIGINAAQWLTLLAYLMTSLILLAIPALMISRSLKNRRRRGSD